MRLQELMQSRLTSEDVTCRRKPSTWELLTVDPKDSRFFSVCSHPSCDALQKKKTKKKRSHKAPEALQLRERFLGTPFGFANLRIWLVNKPPSHPWMLPRRLKPLVKHLPDVLSIGLFFRGLALVLYICIILHPYLWVYLCLALSLDV